MSLRSGDILLVLNCGSATLKASAFRVAEDARITPAPLAKANVSGFGRAARLSLRWPGGERELAVSAADHGEALGAVLEALRADPLRAALGGSVAAVAHRVVHGGKAFTSAVLVDEQVLAELTRLTELAPLHNGPSLVVMRAAQRLLAVPQVAVFDTAFHTTLPEVAWRYPLPYELSERHGIRRFGFHGISYRYVLNRLAVLSGVPIAGLHAVLLHLGNGASAAAVRNGRCTDTTMGFTPLEGLMMGTRSGDIDPALVAFIGQHENLTPAAVEALLNGHSGLLGISGLTNDMSRLLAEEARNPRAALAVAMFCYRARKAVGALLAAQGGADHLVFTGGIGENAAAVRERICSGLAWAGVELDPAANASTRGAESPLQAPGSRLAIWVIPTNEEQQIAQEACALLSGTARRTEARS
jgi:acetate kinase